MGRALCPSTASRSACSDVVALTGDAFTGNQAIGGEGQGRRRRQRHGGGLVITVPASPGSSVTIVQTTIADNLAQGGTDADGVVGGSVLRRRPEHLRSDHDHG